MESKLFENLPPEGIATAKRFFNLTRRIMPFELIVQEGEADSKLYVLEQGVALVKVGGKEVTLLHTGDIFGEVGFVASGKRTASVFAGADDVIVRILSAERFSEFGRVHPELAFTMLQSITFLLASKLQRTNQSLRQALQRVETLEQEQSQHEERSGSLLGRLFASLNST